MWCLLLARVHLPPNVLKDGTIFSKKCNKLHNNGATRKVDSVLAKGNSNLVFLGEPSEPEMKQLKKYCRFYFKMNSTIPIPFCFKKEITEVILCLIALGKSCFLKTVPGIAQGK